MTLLLALGTAWADDLQYRHLLLGDGREFEAIVLSTDGAGFQVRVPQGEMMVGFDLLEDMSPSTQQAYEAQKDWTVLLDAPPERVQGLIAAFKVVPHVSIVTIDDAANAGVPAGNIAKMAACSQAIDCLADLAKPAPWMWIVTAKQEGSNLSFRARTNKGTRFKSPIVASMIRAEQVNNAAWTALELRPGSGSLVVLPPPEKLAPEKTPTDKTPKPTGAFDRDKTVAMSFAPVPGLPSLANHDGAGFGLSLATVVPATVAWVGVVGKNTQSAPSFVGLSVAGFYAFTVVANQAFGLRGHPEEVGASDAEHEPRARWAVLGTPMPQGEGAMLTVAVER